MAEFEPPMPGMEPEEVLTAREAEIVEMADRGQLPCPCCGRALHASKVWSDVYEGIVLYCPDELNCKFREC